MMKPNQIILLLNLLIMTGSMACKTDSPMAAEKPSRLDSTDTNPSRDTSSNRLRIRIGSSTFTATLLSSPTATAFKTRLPLTLSMNELNGNEKFADLPKNLPMNSANPGTIRPGDLMLYGSRTLVLFYEPFRTSYRYTQLGQIDNPAGLATALGSGTITVSFDKEL